MIIFISFIFGLMFGSFANVCIFRIPKNKSIIFPGSSCPNCGYELNWHDNIPIISFLLLAGKCRNCKARISLQYPIVELITGLCFLAVALVFPLDIMFFIYLYTAFTLIVITVIDYYYKIIPDFFSISLIVAGLCSSPVNQYLGYSIKDRIFSSLFGMLLGGGILLLLGFAGEKILKKEAMGGGDIKLLAGIGAILGPTKAISTLFIASTFGSIIAITLILFGKLKKDEYIPFGPFISIAAYVNIFVPDFLSKFIFY